MCWEWGSPIKANRSVGNVCHASPRHTTMNENRVGESIKRTNLLLADERLYDDGNFVRSELRSSERASVTNTRMDICNRNPSAIKSCVITCALDCLHLKLLITVGAHTRTHAGSAEARGYRQKSFLRLLYTFD